MFHRVDIVFTIFEPICLFIFSMYKVISYPHELVDLCNQIILVLMFMKSIVYQQILRVNYQLYLYNCESMFT